MYMWNNSLCVNDKQTSIGVHYCKDVIMYNNSQWFSQNAFLSMPNGNGGLEC